MLAAQFLKISYPSANAVAPTNIPRIPPVAMPRTIHDPREVPIPRSELRVVLTVAVAEEPARWASVGVLCGFLIRLPLLRPLELRRAA